MKYGRGDWVVFKVIGETEVVGRIVDVTWRHHIDYYSISVPDNHLYRRKYTSIIRKLTDEEVFKLVMEFE